MGWGAWGGGGYRAGGQRLLGIREEWQESFPEGLTSELRRKEEPLLHYTWASYFPEPQFQVL